MPRRKVDPSLPSGIYEVRPGWYGIDYSDSDGQRHRRVIGPLPVTKKTLERVHAEVAEGRHLGKRRQVTVAEAIQSYLAGAGAGKRSWKDDRRFADLWTAELGGKLLDKVTPSDLERARNRWAGERARNTVNKRLSFFRRVCNVAIRDGILARNPLRKVTFYRDETHGTVRYLTDEEEAALRAVFPPRWWHVVTFAILTGMRQEEQFSLRWSQVNWDTGRIALPRTKSGKARHVPMHARVMEMLRELQAQATTEWVFVGHRGRQALNPKWFYRDVFLPALGHADLGPATAKRKRWTPRESEPVPAAARRNRRTVTWHSLRHTCASRLVMAGVDLRTVMEIMGHSTLAVTQRYAHLAPAHVMDAINKIGAAT